MCMRACVICSPVLKDSEPCETSPLGVILGRSKCLCVRVGNALGVGCQSFCGVLHVVAPDWLSLTLPEESTAEGTGFQTAEGSALLFLTKKKKKKKVSSEGLRECPASDT